MYKEFLIIFTIVIIHELGHVLVSKVFRWNLEKIDIYPFGGCVKFNEKLNKPIYEELLILLGGPVVQLLLFLLVSFLFRLNFISMRNYILFKNYHYTLLCFNLLPIYPLDGGRILNCIINYLLPYKKGNKLIVYISIILIIFLLYFERKNINFIFFEILLFIEGLIYLKRQNYLFNRLLLERYLEKYKFKRCKVIRNKDNFYKSKRHVIKINDKYITENSFLKERFEHKL